MISELWESLFGPPRAAHVPTEQRLAKALDVDAPAGRALFDEDVRIDVDAAEVLVLLNVERSGAGACYQLMLNERAQTEHERRSYGGYGPVSIAAVLSLPRFAVPPRLNVRVRTSVEGAERIERATLIAHPLRRFSE